MKWISFLTTAIIMATVAGCATTTSMPIGLGNESGPPTVLIHSKDRKAVQEAVISAMQQYGFRLERDSRYNLRFSKQQSGANDFLAWALARGTGFIELDCNTTKAGAATQVTCYATSILQTSNPPETKRADMSTNKGWHRRISEILQRAKALAESA